MTHQELRDAAPAYVLDALDDVARASFQSHLSGCPECRREVDEYRSVAALLALAAPVATPRDASALRARVVRSAAAVRPISTVSAARIPRRSTLLPWLAAASLLGAAASGTLALRERNDEQQLRSELAIAQATLAAHDSTLAAFMGPEVHVVSLSQSDRKPAARVFWNHTRNLFIVTAFDIPRAPEGRTYQLWALRKGKAPLSMGTFNTDGRGRATAIIPVAATIADAGLIDDCGLTLEPSGGSLAPSETPRLLGTWRHVD